MYFQLTAFVITLMSTTFNFKIITKRIQSAHHITARIQPVTVLQDIVTVFVAVGS